MLHPALTRALATAHIEDLLAPPRETTDPPRPSCRARATRGGHSGRRTAIRVDSTTWAPRTRPRHDTDRDSSSRLMAMPICRRRPLGAASRDRSGIEQGAACLRHNWEESVQNYDIRYDYKYGQLAQIDPAAEGEGYEPWVNQTLTSVNDCVVRLAVIEGEPAPRCRRSTVEKARPQTPSELFCESNQLPHQGCVSSPFS